MNKLDSNKAYTVLPDNRVVEVFPKTGYKFKVSTSQSVSSGIIGISVDMYFDDEQAFLHSQNGAKTLRDLTESVENIFELAGYKIAKNITPKEKKEKE